MKQITQQDVEKALSSLEANLASDEEVIKASEQDLDQPEGGDLGNPAKEKMSSAAPGPDKSKKAVKKADADEEGEDEGGEEDEQEDAKENNFEKKMKKKSYAKSFAEEMPEEIETKIDVSDFLRSLVDHTGNTIDALRECVAKSDSSHSAQFDELAAVVEDIQKSQAKIGVVLKAICQQIGVFKAAPAHAAKADTVVKSATAPERKFASGLEQEGTDKVFKSLSENPSIAKSQMSKALCDLVMKGEASDMDVIGFESGGYIRPELVNKLKTVLN